MTIISLAEYVTNCKNDNRKYTEEDRIHIEKWGRHAVKTLPFLMDCVLNKKTIAYSQLGDLLYQNGITEKSYAKGSACRHVVNLIDIIGDYCLEYKYPAINVLVVQKGKKNRGKVLNII